MEQDKPQASELDNQPNIDETPGLEYRGPAKTAPEIDQAKVVARGTGVSMFGSVSMRGLGYLLSIVVARLLGPGFYGLFSLGQSIVNLARSISLLGFEVGATRYTARYRMQNNPAAEKAMQRSLVLLVFAWGSLVALAVIFLAGPLAQRSDQELSLTRTVLRWFAPAIPLSALLYLLTSMAEGQRRITLGVVTRDVIRPALTVVLSLVALWLGRGIVTVVQIYGLSMLAATLLTGLFLVRFKPKIRRSGTAVQPIDNSSFPPQPFSLKEITAFSLPMAPTRILRTVGNYLEIFLLGLLATSADIGIFSAAARSAGLVAFGLQAIMKIYLTLAAELHTKGEYKPLETLQHLATRWATVMSIPPVIAVLLVGDSIMALFGRAFMPYQNILLILALGQAVNAATGPISGTLSMAGHSRLLLLNSVGALSLNIVLDLILINRYGIIGAAAGSAIVLVLANLAAVIEVRLLLGIRSFGRDLLPPALAGIGTTLIVWPILNLFGELPNLYNLVIGLSLIGLIFAAIYWLVAPAEDKQIVYSALARLRRLVRRR